MVHACIGGLAYKMKDRSRRFQNCTCPLYESRSLDPMKEREKEEEKIPQTDNKDAIKRGEIRARKNHISRVGKCILMPPTTVAATGTVRVVALLRGDKFTGSPQQHQHSANWWQKIS